MARRSDTKQRMVGAARQLIREHGYNSMALSDVVERSASPRGSLYYHFPQGKVQMATEAAEAHTREQVDLINQLAGQAATAEDLVRAYIDLARDNMQVSGYGRGCAIAPLVIEVGESSEELAAASRRAYFLIIETLALQFVVLGADNASARELAHATLAGVQGAMVTSRALHSLEPFNAVRDAMASRAHALTVSSD
ncbi:TetR/AcrR family transcriptional regulator [Kibdelosporangium philippinense]|uniref:TetR/AcrR family transcriptional regulator n=1 Tax=Kibdelosporangium philippinense TaxID=211113 RepID=A0ABS8ZA54_9PSEU|nr:TetR/AcrR family transcriptional regulator [Kibdelosporangium philippinense]MCE7004297.1 TetR/AcrR family transcriptional regulator [Kibdelosporangium philippinense]